MNRVFQLSPLLLAGVTLSCESSSSENAGYTSLDSAGVQIVESVAPEWGDSPMRIEAEPFVRIGREEAGPYQFAFVGTGTLLDDGRIVVAEAAAQEIRIFGPSGEHMITLGGAGDGPGEFRGMGRMFAYPGDSIAAFDGRLSRTTIFSIESGEHRTIRNQVEGNYGVFGHVKGGTFLLYSPGGSFRPDLAPGPQWVFTDVIAMDPADGASHVIASLPDRWRAVRPDGNAPMPQPLKYAIQAVTSEGFYWGTPDRYELRLYDIEGKLSRIIRRPVEPRAVDPAMITDFTEGQLERVRQSQGEEVVAQYRARLAEEEYGQYVPLFQGSFVDGEERLWVGSSGWPASQPSWRWSVFSPEGRWLGDVLAPEGVRIVDANHEIVMGIWRDAFDVPHVQLHRLSDGPEEH